VEYLGERRDLSECLRHDCPSILLIVSSKDKLISWLGLIGMLEKAEQRSRTVNYFGSGGIDQSQKGIQLWNNWEMENNYLVNNS